MTKTQVREFVLEVSKEPWEPPTAINDRELLTRIKIRAVQKNIDAIILFEVIEELKAEGYSLVEREKS